ncbi:MAG TPA: DegQ family serine endoprotease [Burkholderiales bacterium]|jgi:serine protease Do|nr:DegQ family serine endoprotease [Burkholderiales bacterium]
MLKRFLLALCLLAPLATGAQLPDFTDLVERQGTTVVNISTTQSARNALAIPNVPEDDPFYEFFRRFIPSPGPREFQSQSLGSGFVISNDGYILTNAHVVDAAEEITVKLNDKREFKAKVIGADRRTDIALLKIDASGLQAVRFGDPGRLKVGEWVVAIGSPFGFENTVTAGIVSAKGRSLPQENFVPFIQTDVAVNPGNSGGPLFNLRGEVVGINSQIYSRTGGFMGLSFAIPIDVANDIVQQLRSVGKVTRGRIGVVIQPITKELAESFGLAKPMGALVNSVEKGGPADKAGIESGDVILRFDGKPVASSEDLPRIVGATRPGTKVGVQLWRNKTAREVQVTIAELQDDRASRPSRRGGKPPATSQYGLALSDLSDAQRKELKVEGGVLVENAQGAAARAGIRRGDVILAVNNQDLKSVEHFKEIMSQAEKGRIVALLVRRGTNSLYIPFRVDGN